VGECWWNCEEDECVCVCVCVCVMCGGELM